MTRTIIIACALLLSGTAHGGKAMIPNALTFDPQKMMAVAEEEVRRVIQEAQWEIQCIRTWPTLRGKQQACVVDTKRINELQSFIRSIEKGGQP